MLVVLQRVFYHTFAEDIFFSLISAYCAYKYFDCVYIVWCFALNINQCHRFTHIDAIFHFTFIQMLFFPLVNNFMMLKTIQINCSIVVNINWTCNKDKNVNVFLHVFFRSSFHFISIFGFVCGEKLTDKMSRIQLKMILSMNISQIMVT